MPSTGPSRSRTSTTVSASAAEPGAGERGPTDGCPMSTTDPRTRLDHRRRERAPTPRCHSPSGPSSWAEGHGRRGSRSRHHRRLDARRAQRLTGWSAGNLLDRAPARERPRVGGAAVQHRADRDQLADPQEGPVHRWSCSPLSTASGPLRWRGVRRHGDRTSGQGGVLGSSRHPARFSAILLLLGIASIWIDRGTNLTTGLGLISAGLAFALQQVVTAVAGYFVILKGDTFNVGDRITIGAACAATSFDSVS